jgi:hypothetical protein
MAAGKAWTARAVEIRDHVLPLIRQHGELQREPFGTQFITKTRWACRSSGETVPVKHAKSEADAALLFSSRTPSSNWLAGRDQPAPSHAAALARNAAKPVFGYGLDVWFVGHKVMSLQWEDGDSAIEVISFRPGAWVAEVLALR